MSLASELRAFLTDPSYDLPLLLVLALALLLVVWGRRRVATPPALVPRVGHEWWNRRPDTVAYVALAQGQYFLALSALWYRLSTVIRDRLGVRIDVPHELDRASMSAELPEPLTLRRVVRDLSHAYTTAYLAERPGWLEVRWAWLRRRQQRRAAREFARAVHDLEVALPVLEAMHR